MHHISNRLSGLFHTELIFLWNRPESLFIKSLLRTIQHLNYNLLLVKSFEWLIYILSKADRTLDYHFLAGSGVPKALRFKA